MGRAIGASTLCICLVTAASADIFGTGTNEFTIDFVTISGDTNPAGGYGIVNNDYRIGVHEITNDQWDRFKAELGVAVTGDPLQAYDEEAAYTGINVPANDVSWFEAAQFINWLNTSAGYQAAYKFTGTQGTSGYALATWSTAEAAGGTNLYRHKDAFYYLPTEDEWVKAAYWNGTDLQTHATKAGDTFQQGDGVSGTGWNFWDAGYATDPPAPWDVGSGSEELNGTFDMMGNVWEWMESPFSDSGYGIFSGRAVRGGSLHDDGELLTSTTRTSDTPLNELYNLGFRVASGVPEPASFALLSMGGLVLIRRRGSS
jgi:formylglycine-generating enzyme required for sulfatase activity